jgi:predicted transcriptional regulator
MATANRGGSVTTDEILDIVRDIEKPYATTAMIQEQTGLSDQSVREKTHQLEQEGELRRDKVGRHWIYYIPTYSYSGSK